LRTQPKFQRTFTASRATNARFHILPLHVCIAATDYCNAAKWILGPYFKLLRRTEVKKISLSIAVTAVLAMTVATSAIAAELPAYEKAGLPISAVQVQALGAEHVQEASPLATSATPVQVSVLTPRSKITTAQGRPATVGRAIQ
jgi:hypothetical protein